MILGEKYSQFGERSRKSVINIISSFGAKGVSVLISLLVVPLTINYVNPSQYGIWLTLSSIIGWIGFFDLGFGNGMRNRFAEAKAKGNTELAKQIVSTTYFTIATIVLGLLVVVEIVNLFIDWSDILNVESSFCNELRKVFAILTAFFCVNMVVRLFTSILTADQRPGLASWISVCGQVLSLGVIFLLTKTTEGSLINLAAFYSGVPTLVLFAVSIYAFRFSSYRQYAPSIKSFRSDIVKDIMNIGIQFFIILLCFLIIFQIINLVISRELGPQAVTEYNIAYKYFNIAYSVIAIILSPFWSAFTDAYSKNDLSWMRKVKCILEKIWLCEIIVVILMIIIAPWFYKLWIGDSIVIRGSLTIGMALFLLAQSIGAVYMHMINGIGTIRIQLIVYVSFALLSLPLLQYSCRSFGLMGILFAPTLVYLIQAVLGKIQLEKLLSGKSKGLWNK